MTTYCHVRPHHDSDLFLDELAADLDNDIDSAIRKVQTLGGRILSIQVIPSPKHHGRMIVVTYEIGST